MDLYAEFAADYEWLFDDDALTGVKYLDRYRGVLDALAPGAAVLDAACGIGIEAAALARLGYRVSATDGSSAMVEEATRRLAPHGIVPTVAAWDQLPAHFDAQFDLVVCNGNALVHADGRDGVVASLAGMRRVLRPGGSLVVGSRNFEFVRSATPRVEIRPAPRRRHGRTCVVVYVWDIPDSWEQTHRSTIMLIFLTDSSLESRTHDITFVPYRFDDLTAWAERAGLVSIRTDYRPDDPVFTMVASAP